MNRTLTIFGLVTLGCGSKGNSFGEITDQGLSTFRSWCKGDLKVISDHSMPTGIPSVDSNADLVQMNCTDAVSPPPPGALRILEEGYLAYDSKTHRLLTATFRLHPATFDGIVNQVIVPALDDAQQAGMEKLKSFARAPRDQVSMDWDHDGIRMAIRIDPPFVPKSEPWQYSPEPTWNLFLVPRMDK